jgi:hypothetical protein
MLNAKLTVAFWLVTAFSTTIAAADGFLYSQRWYQYTDDLFDAVWNEFHLRTPPEAVDRTATVANWDDIKRLCRDDSDACESLSSLLLLRRHYPMLYKGQVDLCSTRKTAGHYFIAQGD